MKFFYEYKQQNVKVRHSTNEQRNKEFQFLMKRERENF